MNEQNVPRNALQILERVQARLHKRKGELGRWEDVAREIGVSLGTTCRVAKGYYPRHSELCEKFGLPLLGEGIICKVHGRVCSVQHRPPKPVTRWRDLPLAELRRAGLNRKEMQ